MSTPSQQTIFRTVLPVLAALWASGVALYLLFAPIYATSTTIIGPNTSAPGVVSTRVTDNATLLEVNGPGILITFAIPIVVALSPLSVRKHRRRALLAAGVLTLGFCILGALSIGWFYLPTALLLLFAGAGTHAEQQGLRR
jgi:hypothetical protein